MLASGREHVGPFSGSFHSVPSSHRDDYMDLNRRLDMPSRAMQPSSYDSLHSLTTSERGFGQLPRTPSSFQSVQPFAQTSPEHTLLQPPLDTPGETSRPNYQGLNTRPQSSSSVYPWNTGYQFSQDRLDYGEKSPTKRSTITVADSAGDERRSKRYRGGRDEFDGSVQYLSKPPRSVPEPRERDLPPLPVHLNNEEQDDVLTQVNRRLSQCAFDFVALYRFPIPMEPDKPPVKSAADKAWTEWAYLLKRLATKRRIPSHAIFQGQIKELTTVLDNSLEMRHASKPQPRQLKDDRTVLQFISAGIQVGRILKDAATMEFLDRLYQQTERLIQTRKVLPLSSR